MRWTWGSPKSGKFSCCSCESSCARQSTSVESIAMLAARAPTAPRIPTPTHATFLQHCRAQRSPTAATVAHGAQPSRRWSFSSLADFAGESSLVSRDHGEERKAGQGRQRHEDAEQVRESREKGAAQDVQGRAGDGRRGLGEWVEQSGVQEHALAELTCARAQANPNTASWSAKMVKNASKPSKQEKLAAIAPVNHQTARALFTKPNQRILLVGEGNFSFACALVTLLGGDGERVTATAYDNAEVLRQKYSDASENIRKLSDSGAAVHLGVDATELETSGVLERNYDLVIFNFPHVGLGIKEQNDNIHVNQALIKAFLLSAIDVVHAQGLVCVTIKKGEPYDSWKVARIGIGLPDVKLKTAVEFSAKDFTSYTHRRTSGHSPEHAEDDNEIIRSGAKTFVFARDCAPVKGARGDDDDEGGRRVGKKPKKEKFQRKGPNAKGSSGGGHKFSAGFSKKKAGKSKQR